jgi:hypothetical protein
MYRHRSLLHNRFRGSAYSGRAQGVRGHARQNSKYVYDIEASDAERSQHAAPPAAARGRRMWAVRHNGGIPALPGIRRGCSYALH